MMFKKMFVALAASTSIAAPAFANTDGGNIAGYLSTAEDFTVLSRLIATVGLTDTLAGPGPFTVFAPTDEAFAAIPSETIESLLLPENRDQLAAVLGEHVVVGQEVMIVDGNDVVLNNLANGDMTVSVDAGDATVGNARVIVADIDAANGVIHKIDRVILPAS